MSEGEVDIPEDKLERVMQMLDLLREYWHDSQTKKAIVCIEFEHGCIRVKHSNKGIAIVLQFKPYIRMSKSREIYLSIAREEFYILASSLYIIALALYRSESAQNKRKGKKIKIIEGFENALK